MILINGDIYIKIKPSIFNPTDEEQQELENKIYDINFEEAHRGANQVTQDIKRTLNSMKEIFKKKGKLDYSYIDDFHVLETDGKNITMKMFERTLEKVITDSFNVESEKMNEYKRLIDFMNEAEFVGRKIKLYQHGLLANPTVIYKTDYAMLIEKKPFPTSTKELKMLDIRSLDKPLGEKDQTVEEYRDKNKLYRTIVRQIDELSKICDKPDEHRRQK